MAISSDGFQQGIGDNVGIGTTNPQRKHEVTGGEWFPARFSSISGGSFIELISSGQPDWAFGQTGGIFTLLSSEDDFLNYGENTSFPNGISHTILYVTPKAKVNNNQYGPHMMIQRVRTRGCIKSLFNRIVA